MPLSNEELERLLASGWEMTRDGSTATARRTWEDPDEPDDGWEMLVLHTAGHPARFSIAPFESGLTERSEAEARGLAGALEEALLLLHAWRGELPDEPAEQRSPR
jgi:hypothetical protein